MPHPLPPQYADPPVPLPPRQPLNLPPDWRERQAEAVRLLQEWSDPKYAEEDARSYRALLELDAELEAERKAALERERQIDDAAA